MYPFMVTYREQFILEGHCDVRRHVRENDSLLVCLTLLELLRLALSSIQDIKTEAEPSFDALPILLGISRGRVT